MRGDLETVEDSFLFFIRIQNPMHIEDNQFLWKSLPNKMIRWCSQLLTGMDGWMDVLFFSPPSHAYWIPTGNGSSINSWNLVQSRGNSWTSHVVMSVSCRRQDAWTWTEAEMNDWQRYWINTRDVPFVRRVSQKMFFRSFLSSSSPLFSSVYLWTKPAEPSITTIERQTCVLFIHVLRCSIPITGGGVWLPSPVCVVLSCYYYYY